VTASVNPALLSESEIRRRIWLDLQRATQDRHHEWRTPVLATVGPDASPQARTVVLRHADSKLEVLQIYTDRRSSKIDDLRGKPEVLLVFWSKRLSWQLRVRAIASLHLNGPVVDTVWAKVSQSAAAGDYLSASAPGHKLLTDGSTTKSQALSDGPLSAVPQRPHHLAVLALQVQEIDWLELARSGHRRAVISAEGWEWRVP
jgi:pyridoxamine 5'-phosphate oxidase